MKRSETLEVINPLPGSRRQQIKVCSALVALSCPRSSTEDTARSPIAHRGEDAFTSPNRQAEGEVQLAPSPRLWLRPPPRSARRAETSPGASSPFSSVR
ncbi:hypothetical protein AAFF_G00373040 [Aldrovandia affinis]|uniref:Uncharacterized protein n=1 Tax=Aldrovandia affinis TaxID=143900 RepID=A0AAD7SGD5_9TELE|nr:hypothetical protein AAFF_G00373040 [Aldrovandia affinis]